jgi:hypothetical protein
MRRSTCRCVQFFETETNVSLSRPNPTGHSHDLMNKTRPYVPCGNAPSGNVGCETGSTPKQSPAVIPAHCNESVNVTRTTAAVASRTKTIDSPHRGRRCFVRELVGTLYCNPNRPGRQALISRGSLLLPAAAKRLVKLHNALELVTAVLRQGQLGAEERALVVEHLEVGGDTAAVALE